MRNFSLATVVIDIPKMLILQALKPLRLAFRRRLPHPKTQREMANLVEHSLSHQIRAGFTHRFITILFVTVGERVFCRRYSYGEPSWHSAFCNDSKGQIKLDKTTVNIEGHLPKDRETIIAAVDQAYADKLKALGAQFMLHGAVEPRAQESTMELTLAPINTESGPKNSTEGSNHESL